MAGTPMTSSNVTWHPGQVTRADRARMGARGATLWFTGLSGSGKSTLAVAVEQRLVAGRRMAYRLDGDNLRTGLNGDLGFDREAREENNRRAAEVACLFADAGVVSIVALISPYASSRQQARDLHQRAGLPFLEVYLATPIELCAQRDPKGLYAKASGGTLGSFTGVGDVYEIPTSPDVVIEAGTSIDAATDTVVAALSRVDGSGTLVVGPPI
ncbi:MAG TPA: adenylyl-sulfate kinase [Acidimicrobiales bacterium]